jgi:hypothetical protein
MFVTVGSSAISTVVLWEATIHEIFLNVRSRHSAKYSLGLFRGYFGSAHLDCLIKRLGNPSFRRHMVLLSLLLLVYGLTKD